MSQKHQQLFFTNSEELLFYDSPGKFVNLVRAIFIFILLVHLFIIITMFWLLKKSCQRY